MQPSLLLQAVSCVVIAVSAALAGGLLSQVAARQDWGLFLIGALCAIWLAWIQILGTFAPHERRANEAGNWLIGLGALAAIALAALPMVAGQPVEWAIAGQVALLVSALVFAGAVNLLWARELRKHDRGKSKGWQFSIRELLAITTAAAICLGSYVLLRSPPGS